MYIYTLYCITRVKILIGGIVLRMKVLISRYIDDKISADVALGEDDLQSRLKFSKYAANSDLDPMRVESDAARMSRQLAAARSGFRSGWSARCRPLAAGSSCSKPAAVRAGLPDYPRWQTGRWCFP